MEREKTGDWRDDVQPPGPDEGDIIVDTPSILMYGRERAGVPGQKQVLREFRPPGYEPGLATEEGPNIVDVVQVRRAPNAPAIARVVAHVLGVAESKKELWRLIVTPARASLMLEADYWRLHGLLQSNPIQLSDFRPHKATLTPELFRRLSGSIEKKLENHEAIEAVRALLGAAATALANPHADTTDEAVDNQFEDAH